ncbi:MAG: Ger(x)C family spore germination protein [Oscillospiraceae bacterium]|jgi:spore germination protein KC
MMSSRIKRVTAALLLLSLSFLFLAGCWDSRTIEDQLILTGIAIDVTDQPGQISITAQVANTKKNKNGSAENNNEAIVLQATGDSLMTCLTEMDRDSGQRLLFPHNQIRLLGIEMAKQGIQRHLDLSMRDQKARFEVPIAIVDGRGEEALIAKLSEMPISGVLLGNLFEAQSGISSQYQVRLIDFVHRILDDPAAPAIPMIQVTGQEEQREIKIVGMAVFQRDKMVGRLTSDESLGYIFSFGNVKKCNISVFDDSSKAGLHIATLDCKRAIALEPDGGVSISLTIHAVANVNEIYGFDKIEPTELLQHLEYLAQEEIKNKIANCLSVAQSLDADIFCFSTMLKKKYPKQWNEIKNRWSELFADLDLNMDVTVRIPETGQIVRSLKMEEWEENHK